MHILQYFVMVQDDSRSPIQIRGVSLGILVKKVGDNCMTVPWLKYVGMHWSNFDQTAFLTPSMSHAVPAGVK